STSIEAVTDVMPLIARSAIPGGPLAVGEALSVDLDAAPGGRVTRFRVAPRETLDRRHLRKYATGKLAAERAFHFRGPSGALDLVAQNLETFSMLARGVDRATWQHHLRSGEIARWLRQEIKDPELADEVEHLQLLDD